MKITKKTRVNELIMKKPEAAEKLFEVGLSCVGCPMAMMETIEEGCLAHGMSQKEIDEIVKELNKK